MHILRKQLLPMIIGGFIPIAIFLDYIFSHHIENLVVDIFFKIPTQVIGLGDQVHPERLWESIRWFVKKMILFLMLAGMGIFLIPKKESHFFSMMIAWLVIGFVVVVMQKTSWWNYHFQLFYVPIALLSILSLDYIFYHLFIYLNINNSWRRVPILLIIVGLITHNQFQLLQGSMYSENYARLMRFDYAKNHTLSVLKVLKEEDTIYVCGNPRKYLMTSRLPELSTNGWILEYYLDYQWQNFYEEFQSKPPTYLFISNEYENLIPKKSPTLWHLITTKYLKFSSEETGIWYKTL